MAGPGCLVLVHHPGVLVYSYFGVAQKAGMACNSGDLRCLWDDRRGRRTPRSAAHLDFRRGPGQNMRTGWGVRQGPHSNAGLEKAKETWAVGLGKTFWRQVQLHLHP